MKSSTLRRSTLSRETINVIETLALDSNQDVTTEIILKPEDLLPKMTIAEKENRLKEIDLLWQSFKTSQFNTKSPFAYIMLGVLIGVVLTLSSGALISYYSDKNPSIAKYQGLKFEKLNFFSKKPEVTDNVKAAVNIPIEPVKIDNQIENQIDEQNEEPKEKKIKNIFKTEEPKPAVKVSTTEKYFVKEGDTGVNIIKRHYGSYSPEIENKVKQANKLETLDRLYIGQELILP